MIPSSGPVRVSIVNELGEPVVELCEGELGKGEHSFTWNASGIASGTYWCMIRMTDRTERISLSVL